MFNDDQKDHMKSLFSIKPEELCWCGWYKKGECPQCDPNYSAADKLKMWCPSCHNAPNDYGKGNIVHIKGCTEET